MNFYTFNSNHHIKKFFFFIILVFILYNVLLNIALQFYVDQKTNQFSFVEEKVSKAKHMKLQPDVGLLDYIFIGSSRTIYHISTEQFKKNNIQIYNFGVSNRGLVDYPYMIKEAIFVKPKHIVINLTVQELFRGGMGHYNSLTLEDMKYILKFQDLTNIGKALYTYIQSKHLLFKHSEPMHIRLSQSYKRFDPKELTVTEKHTISLAPHNKKFKADCTIFDFNHPSPSKTVTKCTNGDGVLFGNILKEVNRTKSFEKLDKNYVAMLNDLLDEITKHDIIPIVILEPVFRQNYDYDLSLLKQEIHANIIDLTKISIADVYWADDKHLNVQGRAIYTNALIKILSNDHNNNKGL